MKRYIVYNSGGFGTPDCEEKENGRWCKYSDVEKLEAELEQEKQITHKFELLTGIHKQNLDGIKAKSIEEEIDQPYKD